MKLDKLPEGEIHISDILASDDVTMFLSYIQQNKDNIKKIFAVYEFNDGTLRTAWGNVKLDDILALIEKGKYIMLKSYMNIYQENTDSKQ